MVQEDYRMGRRTRPAGAYLGCHSNLHRDSDSPLGLSYGPGGEL